MQFVFRAVRSACDRMFGGREEVNLRHSCGALLTHGDGDPVRFASVRAAEVFSDRFLDEAPSWRAVPAATAVPQAA